MIIGGSPGGGFDTLARAIARHIGKHIPGNPLIVPRNMAGAGGLLAMDHLYNIAHKDGSVIALVGNTTPFVPLVTGKPARFDPLKMSWLGTPSVETPMVLVWNTVPVKTVEDLKTKETTMGASGCRFAAGVLRTPHQHHARHQDEDHHRLSRAKRNLHCHGTW